MAGDVSPVAMFVNKYVMDIHNLLGIMLTNKYIKDQYLHLSEIWKI